MLPTFYMLKQGLSVLTVIKNKNKKFQDHGEGETGEIAKTNNTLLGNYTLEEPLCVKTINKKKSKKKILDVASIIEFIIYYKAQ